MKRNYFSVEIWLYLAALAAGIFVRMLNLGALPLSDPEAAWALQALGIARGEGVVIGSMPGYVLPTGLLFFLFGSANGVARFLPALAGSLLVGVPVLLRERLSHLPYGRTVGLLAAFALALDPGLVAASRVIQGSMLGLSFGVLALVLWQARKPIPAGVLAGLALMSGPSFLLGLLSLALAWVSTTLNYEEEAKRIATWDKGDIRRGLAALAATILLLGTLLFIQLEGIGALANILPEFLRGWVADQTTPVAWPVTTLVVYEILPLIFGAAAALRLWKGNRQVSFLAAWAFFAFLLVVVYPGRNLYDLVWTILPLWGLAAIEIARYMGLPEEEKLPAIGQAVLIFILLSLAWINLAGLATRFADENDFRLRLIVIGGTLALAVVSTALIALGWSVESAKRGFVWGLAGALLIYSTAVMVGATQVRGPGNGELWQAGTGGEQMHLLTASLEELSEWRTGMPRALEVVSLTDTPALRWALREWETVKFAEGINLRELPEAVISRADQEAPSLSVAYRGQDFTLGEVNDWQGLFPQNWAEWLVFRKGPRLEERVILWARGDVFPSGTLALEGESGPEISEEDFIPSGEPQE